MENSTELEIGDRVSYSAGKFYATLLALHEDGTATIEFDSGRTKRVRRGAINWEGTEEKIAERARIERRRSLAKTRDNWNGGAA